VQAWQWFATQAWGAGQSLAVTQPTQVRVFESQTSGLWQSPGTPGRQPTWHSPWLQMSPVGHWPSAVQASHWLATQICPWVGQSAAEWQPPNTHTPLTQMNPWPQSESSVGVTQGAQVLDLQTS
jgi:hypothetical protein